jgi:hypothetical protein
MDETGDNVIRLAAAAEALRDDFMHWQCRIRQMAMRDGSGRPSPGMRPAVLAEDGTELHPGIVVVIHQRDPEESTALFRHQVLKTQDPVERWEKATEHMAAGYFQSHRAFDEHLTALFGPEAPIADIALNHGKVILSFAEFGHKFRLPVSVMELPEHDPLYQSTYWHNRLFNPNMPAGVRTLCFTPDWRRAKVERTGA